MPRIPIDIRVTPIEVAQRTEAPPTTQRETVFDVRDLDVYYGSTPAVNDVNLEIYRNMVTALIGPSGCGKSTFIRCLNRMNDLIPGARIEGEILYHGQNLYGVRRRSGLGAALDRDGVPEAEPVPEVDLRQRGVGPAHARHAQGPRRARRARADARRRCGTR